MHFCTLNLARSCETYSKYMYTYMKMDDVIGMPECLNCVTSSFLGGETQAAAESKEEGIT